MINSVVFVRMAYVFLFRKIICFFEPKVISKLQVLFLLLFFSIAVEAQNLRLLIAIPISKPYSVSLDRYDNVFVTDEAGTITSYDTTGKKVSFYSPQKPAQVSQMEAWKSVKIFVFYKDVQRFVLLNRFLTPTAEYTFSSNSASNDNSVGFARIATIANDDNVWVYDDLDFSLKKYNPETGQILLNSPLSLIVENKDYNLNFLREYQNMLFINDANSGILVFDNLGNYKKKLPFQDLNYFGFLDENLYYLKSNKLCFFNLYSFAEKEISLAFVQQKIQFALLSQTRLTLFSEKEMFLYRIEN